MSWTLGIDLASQPGDTAACVVDWEKGRLVPIADIVGKHKLDDGTLLALMRDERMSKVGIDAPFGWPLAFVDALATFRDRLEWPTIDAKEVHFRATELHVAGLTGQVPMSAAMTDLSWPTVRCSRLLGQLAREGVEVDRRGVGLVAEIYPAAALARWQLSPARWIQDPGSYKGNASGRRERRVRLMDSLLEALDGGLELSPAEIERCEDDDDELDAFVCALVARAVEVGQIDPIPDGLHWVATREGWILLPEGDSLAVLASAE